MEFAISASALKVTEDPTDGDGNSITYTVGYTGALATGETTSIDVAHLLQHTNEADYDTTVAAALATAVSGATGISLSGTTLTFSGGTGNDTSLDFTVVIDNDADPEPDKEYSVAIHNAEVSGSGSATISEISVTSTIINDDVELDDGVQIIGGGELPAPNPATGDVDPTSIEVDLLPQEQSEHTVTLSFDEEYAPTADVVFIVDESGSMEDEHAWIAGMVTSLDASLIANGVTGNRYSLVGYLGEGTLFSMTPEPVIVTIYGPDGTQLESQQLAVETTTGLIEGSFTLPASGDYTIVVDHAGGTSSYDYSFVLEDASSVGGSAALLLDELTAGQIQNDSETHEYTFSLSGSDTLYFESLTTDTDLRWSLTGPSGAVVTDRDFDAGGLKIDGESGSYTLTIDGPSEATGSYAFRLLNLSGSSITAGTQINGTLDPATDSLVYELSATAGDRYYFNSQSSSLPAGAQWRLIDPSGTELFSQSLSEDHEPLTTSSTGTYYLVVDGDVADTASTRAFSFTVESLGATSSTALSFGTGYSGSISKAGEVDEYTFTLTGDELLAFDSQTDDGDLAWTLSEATAGTVIADVPLDASDIVLRLGAGTYTLSVDPPGDATGSYDFQILDLASATSLTVDSTESGNLNPANSTAAYKFTAAAGDKYSFDAISWAGSAAAQWRLIDPFGNELFSAAIGDDVPTLHVHAAGDYTLLLEGAIDDSTSNPAFSFEVVDEGSDTSDPAPLALNQVVSGEISASLEEDEYTFTLGSAALVSFDSLTGRDDMYWSLVDGGGTIVNSRALDASDASGVSNANAVLSLSAGTYTLTIDADSGITGDYAFAVLDLSSATTITAGSEVTGVLAASHRTAVYEFTVGAGDQFGFQSVNWAGDADATWRLVNSSGTVLTSGELGANTGLFELTAGGTYSLLIEGTLDDTPVTRPYAFQIELLELSSTLSLSATNSGSISTAGDLHAFTFSATAGENYFVDFADAATTDHYLSIRDAAGAEIARVVYDSAAQPNSVTTFTVAESGTYTVVAGADASSTGSFEFRLIELDEANLTAIDADTAGDFTASGERDVFHFEGAAGREVNLRIDAWGTASELSAASDRLATDGTKEDGYDGIDEALQHLRFRNNAATHFILITDEDRDTTWPELPYNDIYSALDGLGYTLHSIVDINVDTVNSTPDALGIDGEGASDTAYFADGSGGYTPETSGGVSLSGHNGNDATTKADYVDLAFDLGGTAWDLLQLRAGGLPTATAAQVLATESFTAAFVDILTNKITADQMDLVSSDPNVTFEILSETLTEDDISYDIRFTGDGTQYVFDLQFVRDQNGTDTVLGTIPVTLRTHYVQLTENSNFQTLYEDALTIPADAEALELRFFDLQFDTADGAAINDAFEIALLDSDGNPLAGTIGGGRDAFFNMTEGEDPLLGGGVVYDAEAGTVTLDISHFPEGLVATLAVRLVNNDADSTSTVSVDVHPTILTTSPVANPSLTSPSGDGHAPNTIDFNHMIDVTAAVSWEYQVTSFDESSDTLFTGLTLTNDGISPIRGPLLVAVHHIDNPRVQATGYDGLTPDGYAYFDVTHLMEDRMLDPAAALSGLALRFHNPQQVQFNYELQILADLNRSPEFVSDPVTEVVAGESYEYDAAAVDPDGDAVTYSILSGPDTMAIDAETGVITWSPTSSDVGGHVVVLQATDPLGSYDVQTYTLTVTENVPNRPPLFTTIPIVDAYLHTTYFYDSDASDPDGDDLTYSLVDGPQGMAIDAETGAVTWDVTDASLVGTLVSVTIKATETGESGPGHEATQEYLIAVHEAIGNHDPIIISNPQLTFELPGFSGNTATGDVTPTELELHLSAGEVSEQIVSLDYEYDGNFSADIVLIVDESVSMTGGQAWLDEIAEALNAELEAAGYFENRFAIVGFTADSAVFSTVDDPFRVSVYGPDDALVKSVWVPERELFSSALAGWELPSSGEYTVVVENTDGSTATEYSFVLESVEEDVSTQSLTLGTSYTGTIETYAAQDDYAFTIAADDTLVLFDALEHNDQLQWSLTGPGGEVVTDRLLDQEDLVLSLDSGSYTLSVAAVGFHSEDYQFRVVDLSAASLVTLGNSTSGTLDPVGEAVGYAVSITTAGRYHFTSESWNGSTAARWRLVDDTGAEVFIALLSQTQSFVDLAAGDYMLIIDGDVADTTSQPQYQFKVDTSPTYPLSGTSYTIGNTVSGNAGGDVTADTFNFTLAADSMLTMDVLLDHSSDIDTVWTLVSRSGTVVDSRLLTESDAADLSNPSNAVLVLPADNYSLRVEEWNGPYNFRLLDLSAGTSFTPGNQQSSTLNSARETDIYKFTASAGEVYDFTNQSWSGGTGAVWRLVDPSGGIVFSSAIDTDQNDIQLDDTGTYTLLLEGDMADSASSQSYTFDVDLVIYSLNGTGISLDQTVADNLTSGQYNFTLSGDALVYFDVTEEISGGTTQTMSWTLEGADGTYVSSRWLEESNAGGYSGSDPDPLVFDLSAGGYNLTIDNSSQNDYEFRVVDIHDTSLSDVSSLTLDTIVNGTLSSARETHSYTFSATAGDVLAFDALTTAAQSSARWRLIGPDGSVLSANGLLTDLPVHVVTQTGDYALLIEGGTDDSSTSRAYSFEVQTLSLATVGSVTDGTLAANETHRYAFTLNEDALLYFDALTDEADFAWQLLSSSGSTVVSQRLLTASDGDDVSNANAVLDLSAGTYVLDVLSLNSATGDYDLQLVNLEVASDAVVLGTTSGTLSAGNSTDVYRFQAIPGDTLTVDVSSYSGPSGSQWRVVDSGGTVLGSGLISASQDTVSITAHGTYYLLIEGDVSDTATSQSYTLEATLSQAGTPTSLTLDATTSGTISSADTFDVYSISGMAGQELFLDWLSGATTDMTLWLRDADGNLLLSESRSEESDYTKFPLVTLATTGTYTLLVGDAAGGTGAYSFRVLDKATQSQLALGDETSAVFTATDEDRLYRFSGTAGQKMRLRLDAWADVDDVDDMTARLVTVGATEDGYKGIDTALNGLVFRQNVSRQLVLLTDEDRDGSNVILNYNSILAELSEYDATLHAVVDTALGETGGPYALGADGNTASDNIYWAGTGGTYTTTTGTVPEFHTDPKIESEYIDLAFDAGGTVWDIVTLGSGTQDEIDSFTSAFADVLRGDVSEDLEVTLTASDPNVQFEILSETVDGTSITYEVRFTGDGNPHAFDLQFERENSPGVIVGTIPTEIWVDYFYDLDAIDPDNDELTYTLVGETHGATFDNETGLLRWAPTVTGEYEFTALVEDGRGGSDLQTWTVTVGDTTGGNTAPVLASAGPFAIQSGRPFEFMAVASDVDGDALQYQILDVPGTGNTKPAGMIIDPLTGVVSWTPTDIQAGNYDIVIRAADGRGGIDSITVSITVEVPSILETLDNFHPVIVSTPITTASVGTQYTYNVEATDPDFDPLFYELTYAPDGMAIDAETGVISWIPSFDEYLDVIAGQQNILVRVSDGRGGVALQDFTITIQTNPPTITSTPTLSATVGNEWTYQLTVTDSDLPDDLLEYVVFSPPVGVTITQSGLVSWTPTETGTLGFIVEVRDRAGHFDYQIISLPVINLATNTAPTILSIPRSQTIADQTFLTRITASDPEGEVITYSLIDGPSTMTIDASTGMVQWLPGLEDVNALSAPHQYTVRATDARGLYDEQTFDLHVVAPLIGDDGTSVNHSPEITSTPDRVWIVDKLYRYQATATDADGDQLLWSLDSDVANMEIDPATGELLWLPDASQIGNTEVTIRVIDPFGGLATQSFLISVSDSNHPPEFTSDPPQSGRSGEAYTYNVEATDPDEDTLVYALDNPPTGMTIDPDTGVISWTPPSEGSHSVTVTATDPSGWYAYQTYDLTIYAPASNLPPQINSNPEPTGMVGTAYSYQVIAIDPDEDELDYSLGGTPPIGMSIDPDTGLLTWTPGTGQTGVHSVQVIVSDGTDSDDQTFEISVRDNAAPVLTAIPDGTLTAGQLYEFVVSATDADGDALTYSLLGAPSNMTIDAGTGRIRWQTDIDDIGPHTNITVAAEDPFGLYDTLMFDLDVVPPAADDGGDGNSGDGGGPSINSYPYITSTPSYTAVVDNLYLYQATATDPDHDPLEWLLDSSVRNMQIDRDTGLVSWSPDEDQIGDVEVKVRARDPFGASSQQTFLISVVGTNQTPLFTTDPITSGRVGDDYRYAANAIDPDGDPLTYALLDAPTGMTIDPNTGVISWTPGATGTSDVIVTATDPSGLAAEQTYQLVITAAATNGRPEITSTPDWIALVGSEYTYQVTATDPDDDTLEYSLGGTPPIGMSIDPDTGLLTWTPSGGQTGIHSVEVIASDGSLSIGQNFDLLVRDNVAPTIAPIPDLTRAAGETYQFTAYGSDTDGDALTYELSGEPAGMTINPVSGYIEWLTTIDDIGTYADITVTVTDPYGLSASETFDLEIIAPPTSGGGSNQNGGPHITSMAGGLAIVGEQYSYQATATDPDGDILLWSLETDLANMEINPTTGELLWTPDASQIGTVSFSILVSDPHGAWSLQEIHVAVVDNNLPPQFTSTPPASGHSDEDYTYNVTATDPEEETLTFSLSAGPTGMTINPNTGVLTWTPTGVGTFDVVVTVADPAGYAVHQDYDLTIFAPAANLPPQITSTAVLTGMVGTAYSYQVTATDPEDDTLEFSLGGTPPSGMSIDPDTGLLSWTPSSGQTGLNTFEVIVSDGNDTDTQYLGISIRDNSAPTITTIPDATVTAGNGYQYDVLAADADGDALTYSISGEPTGMTIDADTGRIEWQTAIGNIGAHTNITVTVTDEFGLYSTDTFDVTVAADDTPPVVDVTYSHDPARLGTPLSIYIQAVDDVGVDEITLDINGVDVAVDANGNAVYDVASLDPLVVTVTATDTVDNETVVVDNLTVIDPGDVTAPVVAITSITGGEELTEPTDILGTVDDLDDNLVYWTLIATAIDSGREFTLATGGNEITTPALLGNFDTTAIANGLYRLTLTAVDAGGNTATDNKLITVEGNLKLGAFSISFLDMQVSAPGFPITITRSYSTLDAGEQGDFGYGWSLDIANTSVNVEHADTGLSGYGQYASFKNGDRVVITLPDGTTEGFTFYAQPSGGIGSATTYYKPRFVADTGVDSELFVNDVNLISDGDEWIDYTTGLSYNPALEEFGNAYVLRLRNGVELTINASTGELASIHDRYGNALYFTGDGIESSNGRGVDFTRDYAGRITKITDHVGNFLRYDYDQETGNLIAVTDRTDATTQFTYLDGPNDPEHYLDEIIDPLGRSAATTTYDEQGRVDTVTDADGQTISYTYDSGNKTQTITDQLNNTSTVTFDARGNITREEDPLGGITKRTFDDDDNLLTEIMVIGLEDTVSEETNDLLTTYTYDTNGFVSSVLTPDGLETTYVNHLTGTPLIVKDPLGNTTETVVDEYGRPLYLTDALENRTQLIYYGVGTNAADNGQVRYIVTPWKTDDYHGPSDNTAVSFEYDEEGNLISTTNWDQWSTPGNAGDGNYQTNRFTYDDYGNQIGTSRLWQDPNDAENTVTLTTSSSYDDNNRLISHTDAYGHTSTTTYDAAGQVIATTRIIGQDDSISAETDDQTTTMLYDPRGQNIQTTYSDGTITRTVYDAKGRAVYTTDRHLPADDTNGTYYIYDALDRVIETRRHKDLVITITDNNGDFTSAYTSKGDELSSSSSTYDAVSGWLLSSTSSSGSTTTYEYDDFGRTKKITETIGSSSRETNYTYDDFGRQELVIDSYDRETATFYDEYGRVKRTVYHDSTFSETTYDSFGRVATTTDRFGNTRTNTYDGTVGRLIKTETSAGVVTEYEYDYYGQQTAMQVTADNVTARTEYEYDQFGRQVLVRDALGRETSYDYDEYGRVIKTTFDDDSYITSTYDDFGRVLSETDALGKTKNYEYDEQGRLIAVILPEVENPADTEQMVRPRYEYEYDAQGNRTVIRDNVVQIGSSILYDHDGVTGIDSRETLFTYDDFGNQLTRELPLGQTEYFEYDEETLRLIQHTDFEGNITESVYSDLGFLDELQYFAPGSDPETDPADETVEYTYNSLDQREQITDTRGDTDYTYDEFDRLSQIDTPEGVLNYEYDNYGRQVRKSIGNPADPTHDWTYSYDALGRLKTVSTVRRNGVDLATAEVTTYSYDLVGNLSRVDYANGMITTYEYDALNRLDVMTHYSPDETPENLADNDKLAEYDYTVRADGRRTAVTEKYWESGTPYTTDIAWTYDNLGRLVEEDYDSHDNDLDYTTTFTYDLVGNRLSKVIDGIVDKTLTYEYDDNDRLLTSWKIIGDVDDGVNLETDDTTTTYGYTGTQQTSKTIKETYSTQTLSVVDYSYDLQGRMSEVVIDTYDSNDNIVKKETTTYVYDGRGIRVGSTYKVEVDDDQNPATALVVTKHEETSYLVDDMNPTGYAQVIEKIVREAGTATVTDAKVFTLGHDVIDQTTFTPGGTEAGSPLTLLYDGHGSTRAVLDATAAFVQHYAYTAYGRAIGFDEAQALTALLYSGEAFDSRVGLQYLRARWYDPNAGRFNRLDPFSGNLRDPQSLHKYAYVHGDPVNGIDPTGRFLGTVLGVLGAIAGALTARGSYDGAATSAGGMVAVKVVSWFAVNTVARALLGYYAGSTTFFVAKGLSRNWGAPRPIWLVPGEMPGETPALLTDKAKYQENVLVALNEIVDRRFAADGDLMAYQRGREGARKIADAYVNAVWENMGDRGGWLGNIYGGAKCFQWVKTLSEGRRLNEATTNNGWELKIHYNTPKFGDTVDYALLPNYKDEMFSMFLPITPLHSFMTLTYRGKKDNVDGTVSRPDVVLDSWTGNRPDIYIPSNFNDTWPLNYGDHSNIDMSWPSN